MKYLLSTLLLLLTFTVLTAQKEGNIWYMGNSGANPCFVMGIDYNSGVADTFSMCRQADFFITNSSICDSAGQILFYTNGYMIANRMHDSIPGSKGFNPSLTNPEQEELNIHQGTLILPVPEKDSLYYVFHVNLELSAGDGQPTELRYTLVDMTLDAGLGGVANGSLNKILYEDTLVLGRLTATRHANGIDWWLLSHKYNSDEYLIFHVKKDTIIGPKRQSIGSVINFDIAGHAVFSPNGNFFAMTGADYFVDVFKFDRCFGNLYDHQLIDYNTSYGIFDSLLYVGCAISGNSRYLYANNQFFIYQFDLEEDTIENSIIEVAEWDSLFDLTKTSFYQMQLTPINTIHVGTRGGTVRHHVIHDPDSVGLACNVAQNILMPQFNTQALPNLVNYVLDSLPKIHCDSIILSNENIEFDNQSDILVYPVPSNEFVYFKIKTQSTTQHTLELYTTSGQHALYKTVIGSEFFINRKGLTSGIYFYRIVSSDQKIYTGKLVFE